MSTAKSELIKLGKHLGYTLTYGARHVMLTHPMTGVRVPVHNGSDISTGMARKIAGQLRKGTTQHSSKDNRPVPPSRVKNG